jgi:class 3 adenylate cyclase
MQQIADWLEKLGLGQYAQRFAENDIDVSVLPYLTDADLEKIGVSLGHRRKILAAIAELSGASSSKTETANGIVEPKPQDVAERRQVTVMFSDLVGSTASRRAWTLKTCARLSAATRSVLPTPCSASEGS